MVSGIRFRCYPVLIRFDTRHLWQHSATVSDGMDGGFRLGFTAKLVSDAIRLNPIQYKAFIGVFQAIMCRSGILFFC